MTLGVRLQLVVCAWCLALTVALGQEETPLVWSGSFGGGGFEELRALAVGPDGHIWAAGSSDAPWDLPAADLDVEIGADRAGFDVVVVRISPDGRELLYKAILGGPDRDVALGIDVSAEGIVTISGMASAGFPVSDDAYQPENGGGLDVFVARLDPSRDDPEEALLYGTFLGGFGEDMAVGVHAGEDGIVRVAGHTGSTDFPTVEGAYSEFHGGGVFDLFVSCLDPTAAAREAQLVYSTFLGGWGDDACICDQPPGPGRYARYHNTHMTVAQDGSVLMAGHTASGNFPTTPGAYDGAHNGNFDLYVFRLVCDAELPREEQLVYSTLVGGEAWDAAEAVRVGDDGHVWVLGYTWSSTFPTTPDAFQRNPLGMSDGFIVRLDPTEIGESQLVHSTRFGGSGFELPGDLLLLPGERALAVGRASSSNFPSTCGALDTGPKGESDAFALILDMRPETDPAERLVYGTFWGGFGDELFRHVRPLAEPGLVAVAGWSTSIDTPAHGEPFQPVFGGSQDSPLAVFDVRVPTAVADVAPLEGEAPLRVEMSAAGSSTPSGTEIVDVSWRVDGGGGLPGDDVMLDFEDPGRYVVELTVTNSAGHCDRTTATVTVRAPASDVSPWSLTDIGDPGFPGGARRDGTGDDETLVLVAGGDRLSGSDDALAFLWQPLDCDGTLTARVDAVESLAVNGQVGVQLREGPEAGARHASLVLEGTLGGGTRLRLVSRGVPDGATTYDRNRPTAATPLWLRLERAVDEVRAAYASGAETPGDDGWTAIGAVTLPGLTAELLAGLAGMGNEPGDRTAPFRPLTATFREVVLACAGAAATRGDANGDGQVNIADASYVLNWLFLGGPEPPCTAAADANGDGQVNIADGSYILNRLFLGGPEFPPPPPRC